MPYLFEDKYRKVSEPTEADFARGLADSNAEKTRKGTQNFLAGLVVGILSARTGKRRR